MLEEESFSVPPLPPRRTLLWIAGGFLALLFAVYGGSLTNLFVRWDDGLLIYENPVIRSITPRSFWKIFTMYDPELYIPLTFFTYQVDYLIGGTVATMYHLQNLLWHSGNALLVSWLVWLLTRKGWAALLSGLLFAVHPLHTEAVVWASARKDVLSTFFFLASAIAYLTYRGNDRRGMYWLSLALFLLGLLAKVTVVTLPVVLLLFDFRERRRWSTRMIAEKLPFFALAALFAFIAWQGKAGVLASSTLVEKTLMAPVSTIFYLRKFFVPVGLSVLYPFFGTVTISRPEIAVPLILSVILLAAAFITLRWTREVLFGFAFFLLTLSPTLGNFAKGDFLYFASDRYAYAPSIGIIVLVVLALVCLCSGRRRPLCIGGILIVLCTLAVLANLQSSVWRDSESLFRNTLRWYPESHVALNNLANYRRLRGEHTDVVPMLTQALAISRKYTRAGSGGRSGESKILVNLASEYRDGGDLVLAEKTAREAMDADPGSYHAVLGYGVILYQQRRYDEAERAYRRAIMLGPLFATAHINLGALLVETNRIAEGIAEYRAALDLNPFYPQAHYNLGVILKKTGKTEEAEAAYREAVKIQPHFSAARLNLGILLYNDRKDVRGAIEQFEAILTYDPTHAQARRALQQISAQ